MKNISLIAIGSLLLATTSCREDNILDLKPYNQIDESTVFSTPSLIDLAVNGVYNAAAQGYYRDAPRGYPFGAAYFQQNDNRGEDVVNTQAFYRFTYTSSYNATGSLNNIVYWEDTYKLLNRCNLVIEGVRSAIADGVITQEVGNIHLGQVLFLRAWAHFELSKHFARPYHHTSDASHPGIPLLLQASKDSKTALANSKVGRSTVKVVYDHVLADLDEAEKMLAGTQKQILRVSKYAPSALKTRVYLNMGRWQDVIREADKLNGQYALTENPNDVYSSPRNNKESIFSLDQTATNNNGVNAALASMYSGRLLVAISPVIWNSPSWSKDDLRRSIRNKTNKGKTELLDPKGLVDQVNGVYYTAKYKETTTFTDPSPLLRYSEVLLNRAEAKARLGDSSYLTDLNAVRNRSNGGAYPAFGSKEDAVRAIVMEKRIEFLLEGMRWQDIHRLQNDPIMRYNGIPAKYANKVPDPKDYVIGAGYTFKEKDLPAISYDDYRFLWPIPATETLVNPVLAAQQNPGY